MQQNKSRGVGLKPIIESVIPSFDEKSVVDVKNKVSFLKRPNVWWEAILRSISNLHSLDMAYPQSAKVVEGLSSRECSPYYFHGIFPFVGIPLES